MSIDDPLLNRFRRDHLDGAMRFLGLHSSPVFKAAHRFAYAPTVDAVIVPKTEVYLYHRYAFYHSSSDEEIRARVGDHPFPIRGSAFRPYLHAIVHELVHYRQMKEGDMCVHVWNGPSDFSVIWRGEVFDWCPEDASPEERREAYRSLPWEREANDVSVEYLLSVER